MAAGAGAALGLATLLAYLALILSAGDDELNTILPWAGAMVIAVATATWGVARARPALIRLAGAMFIVVGLPALASVGLPLLASGVVCLVVSGFAKPG